MEYTEPADVGGGQIGLNGASLGEQMRVVLHREPHPWLLANDFPTVPHALISRVGFDDHPTDDGHGWLQTPRDGIRCIRQGDAYGTRRNACFNAAGSEPYRVQATLLNEQKISTAPYSLIMRIDFHSGTSRYKRGTQHPQRYTQRCVLRKEVVCNVCTEGDREYQGISVIDRRDASTLYCAINIAYFHISAHVRHMCL